MMLFFSMMAAYVVICHHVALRKSRKGCVQIKNIRKESSTFAYRFGNDADKIENKFENFQNTKPENHQIVNQEKIPMKIKKKKPKRGFRR
jgi:hypothetical protein